MFIPIHGNAVAFALRNGHRNNFFSQSPVLLRRCRLRLACRREGVLVYAVDFMILCHILGRFTHGVSAVKLFHLWVYETPSDGCIVNFCITGERG